MTVSEKSQTTLQWMEVAPSAEVAPHHRVDPARERRFGGRIHQAGRARLPTRPVLTFVPPEPQGGIARVTGC